MVRVWKESGMPQVASLDDSSGEWSSVNRQEVEAKEEA